MRHIKQLLNEDEHNLKVYLDRGQFDLPKPKADAYNIDGGLDKFWCHA